MFDSLGDKLEHVFKKLRGDGEDHASAHIEEALREVRMALLEADVHLQVVKQFTEASASRRSARRCCAASRPSSTSSSSSTRSWCR